MTLVSANCPVLILGSSPTALAVLRELAQAGFHSLYLADCQQGCAARSRYKTAFYLLESWQEMVVVCEQLQEKHRVAPFLVATSDEAIVATHQAHAHGISFRTFASLTNGLAVEFLDKQALARRLANDSDFPQPATANGVSEDKRLPLRMPFFCKPREIHQHKARLSGKKGIIIRQQQDWDDWLKQFGHEAESWLFQEIIAGAEDNIALYAGAFDAQRQLLGEVTARKLRQYPPGFGSASLAISEHLPDLANRARDFLQKAGFQGVCCGEFKWCPKRQDWVVIEFNPRPSLWYALATASGQPLVSQLLVCQLAGKEGKATSSGREKNSLAQDTPAQSAPSMPAKTLWRYGLKDAAAALFYRRHGQQFVVPAPAVRKHLPSNGYHRVYPVFQWLDPGPAWGELLNYARKGWQRLKARVPVLNKSRKEKF